MVTKNSLIALWVSTVIVVGITVLMLPASKSEAALIVEDLVPGSSDGLIIRDDVTGLEWLKVTVTLGLSKNQVLASPLITSGQFRYATRTEVEQLFTSVGLPIPSGTSCCIMSGSLVARNGAQEIIAKFGTTNTQVPLGTLGLLESVAPLSFDHYRVTFSPAVPSANVTRITVGPDFADNGAFGTGSWLVRNTQPEVDDSDEDGVPDDEDVCPGFDDAVDLDGDGVPDGCDSCPFDENNDADGDGICGDVDVCPGGDDTVNTDGDLLPDFCDTCPVDSENDADGDGLCESDDNCPTVANSDQLDTDGDTDGDACDLDDDDDGVDDDSDNCPLTANADQANTDGDAFGDVCDTDDDNDGVVDGADACQSTAPGEVVNDGGCSIADLSPCENNWKNHGAYVRGVAHAAEEFVAAGLISEAEKDAIVAAAAQSDCGQ